jgi:hypothetical protein
VAKPKPKVREIDLDQQRAERKSPMDYRGPTQGRIAAAGGSYVIGGDRGHLTFTMQDSPLDRLHGRRAIGDKEYSALKRYYHHWHCAGLQSAVGSVDLNRIFASDPGSMSGMAKSEKQFYHRQEYRAARKEIGHRPGIVVDNVVCAEVSIEIAGYSIGFTSPYRARQAATEMLRDAGYRLARFWGMA